MTDLIKFHRNRMGQAFTTKDNITVTIYKGLIGWRIRATTDKGSSFQFFISGSKAANVFENFKGEYGNEKGET